MRRACRFKSCHPYQRCDANCCIAFFVSRNRNYVAPLVGSSAALGFLKCYALDSPSACGHPHQSQKKEIPFHIVKQTVDNEALTTEQSCRRMCFEIGQIKCLKLWLNVRMKNRILQFMGG